MREILGVVAKEVFGGLVFIAILAVIFVPLERLFSSGRGPRAGLFKRKRLVDIAHVMIGAPFGKLLTFVPVALAIVAWAPLILLVQAKYKVTLPVSFKALPVALQIPIALLLADFVSYWTHRLFHQSWFWRLHAVHHSSKTLDWLSAVRNHPIAEALGKAFSIVPFLVMGVDGKVLAVLAPILGLYAVLLHANVPWSFGPLRYVIATPIFHRWHHSSDVEAHDKNFAGLFPIWDLLFGTWYVPVDPTTNKVIEPTRFGVRETVRAMKMPETFVGQMIFPLSPVCGRGNGRVGRNTSLPRPPRPQRRLSSGARVSAPQYRARGGHP
jgi:sterol desaturase/sphingolipid hydroxylase (fatty acid hydroxylase superfamily)